MDIFKQVLRAQGVTSKGYAAVLKYLKRGDFYIEVEMATAQDTWPGSVK